MANVSRQQRVDFLDTAMGGAEASIARLEELSNSGNPDVAAQATAALVRARNASDDLAAIQAIVGNKAENGLKPISDLDLATLAALENAIDTRIRTNQLINAGLTAATNMIQDAESVGQILQEA